MQRLMICPMSASASAATASKTATTTTATATAAAAKARLLSSSSSSSRMMIQSRRKMDPICTFTSLLNKRRVWTEGRKRFIKQQHQQQQQHPSFLSSSSSSLLFNRRRTATNSPYSSSCLLFSSSSSSTESSSNNILKSDWQTNKELIEYYNVPAITVPNEHVHHLIGSILQPYLATHMKEIHGIHPRLKIVRDIIDDNNNEKTTKQQQNNNNNGRKLILLDPHQVWNTNTNALSNDDKDDDDDDNDDDSIITSEHLLKLQNALPKLPMDILHRLVQLDVHPLPPSPQNNNNHPPHPPPHPYSSGIYTITIPPHRQTISKLLHKLLPSSIHPPPSSFEQVGHIIHLNLKDRHLPYKQLIGNVVLDRFYPRITMVVNKIGDVHGLYRTYPMEIIAMRKTTKATTTTEGNDNNNNNSSMENMEKDEEDNVGVDNMESAMESVNPSSSSSLSSSSSSPFLVNVIENGIRLQFHLDRVYWCSKLSGDRTIFLQKYFQSGQIIADAFCGVGALCIRAACESSGNGDCSTIWANDINPWAVQYCYKNAIRNGIHDAILIHNNNNNNDNNNNDNNDNNNNDNNNNVDNDDGSSNSSSMEETSKFKIVCGDAIDFIQNIGIAAGGMGGEGKRMPLPHHLIMNYPLGAPSFLGALRWWPTTTITTTTKSKTTSTKRDDDDDVVVPTVHVYTFARADDDDDNDDINNDDDDNNDNIDDSNSNTQQKQQQPNESSPSPQPSPRNVLDVAIDQVAEGLLPEGGATYQTKRRKSYLNGLGCQVIAREVRDVAPGKVVVCVSFRVTNRLLRTMQGDFV